MKLLLVGLLVACSSASRLGETPVDAPATQAHADASLATLDTGTFRDDDGDGLDDAYELQIATEYLPFVSLDPADGCSLDGFVVRVRPHPADATKILVIYDHLFQNDCGLNGHIGDDEVFGVAIDPARPAPDGILAIRAASHQNTLCERDTQCSTCGATDSRPACDVAMDQGKSWPVVYASKAKHGQYATLAQCPILGTCLDQCTLNTKADRPPIVNVGEPGHPLVSDLTTDGFVTAANGWTEPTLLHFDPWVATTDFGGAGNIASDLVDPVFEAAICP